MPKREFLMLAHKFDPKRHFYAGHFASSKLDGIRAYWDGGISRGLLATEVPWANVEKHGRFVGEVRATGLWSRYGQVLRASDSWLDKLPQYPLDGELWCGNGKFQETISITRSHESSDWDKVKYMVFDSPDYEQVLSNGVIENANFRKYLVGCADWARQRARLHDWPCAEHKGGQFISTYNWLQCDLKQNDVVQLLIQTQLPGRTDAAIAKVNELFESVLAEGGEGLMIRDPYSLWVPERSHKLIKLKPFNDLEVTVIGFTFGKETEKGSRHLGRMGSLRCKTDSGVEFDLSGFTDEERELDSKSDIVSAHAHSNPGLLAPDWIDLVKFKRGDRITIRYRELTLDGCPKEGRFYRKRVD